MNDLDLNNAPNVLVQVIPGVPFSNYVSVFSAHLT